MTIVGVWVASNGVSVPFYAPGEARSGSPIATAAAVSTSSKRELPIKARSRSPRRADFRSERSADAI